MDLKMTDEQALLLESVREFCGRYVTEEKVQQWCKDRKMPDDIAKSYLEAGFGLMGIPEEYGGVPADKLTLVLLIEELHHRIGTRVPFILNGVNIFNLLEFGSSEQIQACMDFYKKTGQHPFAMAISESGAGSDNSAMLTTANMVDGKIVINGEKNWITDGEYTPYLLVFAKDEDPSPQNKSISAWLIPRDTPGVTTVSVEVIAPTVMPICKIYLNNVVIDESYRFGERGKGFINLMKNLEMERLLSCAVALGLAQAAMDDASVYANQRIQFGRTIGGFQLIQEKLADMETKLMAARTFLYKTAWELDNGKSVQLNSALLKRYLGQAATEICSEAMQILGGVGFTTEARVGRLWEECRGIQFQAGTDEIMVHIAGRQVLKKYAR